MTAGRALVIAALVCLAAACKPISGLDGACELEPGGDPARHVCRLAPDQCGCPDGQLCVGDGVGGRRCDASGGSTPVGGRCDPSPSVIDCVGGSQCFPFTGANARCLPYCADNTDCPSGSLCIPSQALATMVCSPVCTPPTAASDCGAGTPCFAYGIGGVCRAVGPVGLGESCATQECQAGLQCDFLGPSDLRCFTQCGEGLAPCPDGSTCGITLLEDVTQFRFAGPGEWGVCF